MSDRDHRGFVIAIAGAIGSGKSTIAEHVSQRLDIPVHPIDDDKQTIGSGHADFDRWVAEGIPFPDDFRRLVFDLALDELATLAALHPCVIVEESFHRAELRDPFFRAAEELFGGMCLIEIVVSPDVAIAHLQKRARDQSDHMAGQAMFDAFAKLADPLVGTDLVVENNGDLDSAVDEVCQFLATFEPTRSTNSAR